MIDENEIVEIEKLLDYSFNSKELLKTAFNHVSHAAEKGERSNEALEFLGDGVLNFVVAEFLYDKKQAGRWEKSVVGEMSVTRTRIVSRAPLANEVERLGLLPYLKLSAGFDLQHKSQKFVSNLYEAVLAAVYKDSDIVTAKEFVKRTLLGHLKRQTVKDYKTKLQEIAQARKLALKYEDSETGHPPRFSSKVYVDGKLLGEGKGERKKEAQQVAAKVAAAKLTRRAKKATPWPQKTADRRKSSVETSEKE
ncbi:MAG: ribonuclease III [Firmicutes bacterium]|nr:ribonuclease III [Bacillota bacterium]